MRRVFVASMLVILMMFSVGTYSFQSIDGFEDTDVLIGEGEESATDGRQTATHAEWTMDTLMFSASEFNLSGFSDTHPPTDGPNDGVSHYHVNDGITQGGITMNSMAGGDSYWWDYPGGGYNHFRGGDCAVAWGMAGCGTDFEMDDNGNMYVVGQYQGERMVFPNENTADIVLNNSGGGAMCSSPDANSLIAPEDKWDWTCSVDTFVAKQDASGTWLWAKRIDNLGGDGAYKLAVNPVTGSAYIGGFVGGISINTPTADGFAHFGPHQIQIWDPTLLQNQMGYTTQYYVGYVAKLDTNGVWEWAEPIEDWDNHDSIVYDVAVDPRSDEVYFIGEIGPCDPHKVSMYPDWPGYLNCPTVHNNVIGKMAPQSGLGGSMQVEWVNYEETGVHFQELEFQDNGVVVTGSSISTSQHSLGTTPSVQSGDSFVTRVDDSGGYEWTKTCQGGSIGAPGGGSGSTILGMAASSANIAIEVIPGTQCGQLNNGYHGFQIVTLDSNGNWLWATGDSFDSSSGNLPLTLSWTDDYVGQGSLEFDDDGNVVSVRLFQKLMKIGGSSILPSHHSVVNPNLVGSPGYTNADYYGIDMHFSRFDIASGGMMWSYVEDLPDPCMTNCPVEYYGYPAGYDLGTTQTIWDIEVGGVWDIRLSGRIVGHDVQLHDGMPNSDIPYTGPPNHYTRNYYSGGVYFADFEGCIPAPSSPVLDDGNVATTAARWIGDDHNHTWDNYSLLVDPVRYECANETVTPPVTFGCTDPAATNYDPAATVDDGTCVYPAPPLDDCCAHYGSIVNLTGVEKLHIMEITAPSSAGSPQGSSAGFYDISYDIAQETMPGGILVTDFSDSQQMAYSGPMGVGTANNCDLLTGARECYDFYLSDSQGNFDPYGGHLAIRLYASSMAAGNIDGVWLEFTNGNIAYAAVVTHYDPGVFQTYGGGHSLEALGPVSNDPAVTPISNPTGYTQMGGGPGGDFTTLVLCFDVLVNPEYRSGVVEGNEVDRDEEVAAGLGITGAGNTADIVVVGGAGLIVGMGVSSMMVRLRGREPIIIEGELQKEEPTFRD